MIIMLNGSFGVGKTTTAMALAQMLPNAHVFDPEDVGQFVRYLTADLRADSEETGNFQDIGMWPGLTVATANLLYRSYGRRLIVPMTLVNRAYLDAIRSGFQAFAPVYHFCLVAPWATVQQRLLQRGDGPERWAWQQAERAVARLSDSYYGTHINTEQRSIGDIAEEILANVGRT